MLVNRTQVLEALAERRPQIATRFGVKRLSLFGSAARDELRDSSDVDVLVEFEGPATYRGYFELKDYLEALLGRTVDLVTDQGLRARARRHVERDLVRVA
ncbi:MAG: nucleotidyltransferase family protein [Burkholderiales bacterium]|nr:nucleotidyltransferase family protein [Burkholderiales bacterium]